MKKNYDFLVLYLYKYINENIIYRQALAMYLSFKIQVISFLIKKKIIIYYIGMKL